MEDVAAIPPNDIESTEMLPADEESIERYGEQAAYGVMLVTLRYDQAAVFSADSLSFNNYIARQVKWEEGEPAARVILRYTVTPEGNTLITQELESTDSRLKRRILKAIAEAPCWQPAHKNGTPVESEGVLHVQLPEGKQMPRQVELVWR
jgi:TonB-dependent receptor